MPVIDYEELQPDAGADLPAGTKVFKWPAAGQTFADGDTGKPLACGHYPDKCLQVRSSNYNSGTVTMRGATHAKAASQAFDTLHEPGGNALAYTANGINQILENPVSLSPIVAGGAPTALEIIVLLATTARR